MNTYDALAQWYLRLNGYFTMPTFIAHRKGGPHTDVDVLGVRLPFSREYPDDEQRLGIPTKKIDIVFAESRAKRCQLNGPWKEGRSHEPLEYVLRRVGIFSNNDLISKATDRLYAKHKFEDETASVRIVCFGSKTNGTLSTTTQILWPDVLAFIHHRFRTYSAEKVEHQHWDTFGKYLWRRLIEDAVPEVTDLMQRWNDSCPCWP